MYSWCYEFQKWELLSCSPGISQSKDLGTFNICATFYVQVTVVVSRIKRMMSFERHFTHSKSVLDFSEQKDFMDFDGFLLKTKGFLTKVYEFF